VFFIVLYRRCKYGSISPVLREIKSVGNRALSRYVWRKLISSWQVQNVASNKEKHVFVLSQSCTLAGRDAIISTECSYTVTAIYKLVLVALPTTSMNTGQYYLRVVCNALPSMKLRTMLRADSTFLW